MPNLVGTGLNQVPTNSMLGGLAYQDPEHASIKDLDLKNLSQINSEIADTAVDVFVYDTRKDSDGGAWRKRTQNTSWYNETLNTATRGSRKEFPAVAVIVAEYEKLTIYDGDDPDLPMWMIFNYGTNNGSLSGMAMLYSNGKAVSALNGIISSVGSAGWHDGLTEINFLADFSRFRNNSNVADWSGGIITRNTSGGYGSFYNTSSMYIVSASVNDVAMTVMPNAPIDATTGLPIPTIAVATAGNTSIIKDDGIVLDLTGFNPITTIHIDEDNVIGSVSTGTPSSHDYIYKTHIPLDDEVYNAGITAGSKNYYMNSNSGTIPLLRDIDVNSTAYDSKDEVVYRGGTGGFDIIMPGVNYSTTHSNPAIAYIASNYNTGYMPGDIKGAFLSDTDTTNLTGGNKITNGDAWSGALSSTSSTPPTGWTGGNGAKFRTNSGGDGTYINLINADSSNGGPNSYMYQAITTVAGRKYKISLTQIHHATITVFFAAAETTGGSQLLYNSFTSSSSNTPRELFGTFTATGTTTYIRLGVISGTNDYWVGWDNVIVTEVVEDRSLNANGLHSYGTITKTAVATGAELVAYSNFSGTNVLRQPPNSDMNLGTSDAHIMAWYKTTASGSMQIIAYEGGADGTNDYGKPFNIRMVNGKVTGWASHDNFSSWNTVYDSVDSNDGQWHCAVWVRFGTNFLLYRDGEGPIAHWSSAGVNEVHNGGVGSNALSDSNTELVIGARKRGKAVGATDHEEPFTGSIALARIGKSAPSAAQIKKMYQDEKCLFHENAKATLYGSSDAVTALAYDDTTDLLHVGTSAGRSEFQGLRRINNTTTAVTTAISASNELVAEQ